MDSRRYVIILEPTATGYSAYAPDVPGCVATGATREEAEREMRDALAFHLEGMLLAGLDLPVPASLAVEVDVPLPSVVQA